MLTEKLADIHAGLFGYERTITDQDLVTFLQLEFGRVGADTHLTPREVIRDFVELLDILYQTEGLTIEQVLGSQQLPSFGQQDAGEGEGNLFAEFEI